MTGSIACYKAADLASRLTQSGAHVDVLLTAAALQFVTPLTFQSVTGRRAYSDADLWGSEAHVLHIGLGKQADLMMIAPASANTLAKLANGIADNLLTVTALAARCPLLVAPAMDGGMYQHPATQANLETLRRRGVHIVGPAMGHLASGLSGIGRMVEPLELVGHARQALGRGGVLSGRRLVVTAGGTQEPLDPVRAITNRSSGKQGFALAQAAIDRGAEVTLIVGATSLASADTPVGAQRVDVRTAQEMLEAVLAALPGADGLLMAAAVADFRPAAPAAHKIKKEAGAPQIHLEPTPDILAAVRDWRRPAGEAPPALGGGWQGFVLGFAAELRDLLDNARHKLQTKQLDMIAANDISAGDAGFAVDANRVTLLYPDGRSEPLPLMSKAEVAAEILERVAARLTGASPGAA